MKQYWHQKLFSIHRVTGLIAGLMLLFVSITGSLLVFSEETDEALHHDTWHLTPGPQRKPLFELLDNAGKSLRGGTPYLFFSRLPQTPEEPAIVRAEYGPDFKVYLFLNPYTGEVIHQHTNTGYFSGFLVYLHFSLLSGKTGAQIMLLTGILLFISLLTGCWVYRKSVFKVLTFRVKPEWNSRTRRWRNLHRIVGVWALLFNLLIAFTGFMMELKVLDNRKNTANPYTGAPIPIHYEALLTKAADQIPGFEAMGIRPPKKAGDPVRILGHAHEAAIWGRYSSSVHFDLNGNVKKTVNFSQAPFGDKFNAAMAPLHFGNYGGIPIKILYSLLGLTPGILSISGILIWYRRKYIIKKHQH
ncbi:PepSY domain-containing protein [Chitinophaga sp. HK235]|uniref:PepSY-associated TM helix domain-containing protein n=1 Tax=Chitinophaga sp. HK235 TaxID=2952571 RepID=UPI001BA67FA5|nr:PepSY-associated TM helix domain-containing protein [Chitinophaga sp. HK235]